MTRTAIAALVLAALTAPGTTLHTQETHQNGRGWLGVAIQDVTPRLARERDLAVKSGAMVSDVTQESPASRAGIRKDDVIVEFNGKAVEESDDLRGAVRALDPGTVAGVTLYRGKEKKTFQVTLGPLPRGEGEFGMRGPMYFRIPRIPRMPRVMVFSTEGLLGLTLMDLRGQLGDYFGAPHGRGVLVENVEQGSRGEKAGFMAGDVIIRVGKEPVENTEDIRDALEDLHEGETADFGILRKGENKALTVESPGNRDHRGEGFEMYRFQRDAFRRGMDRLKDELRELGSEIRSHVRRIGEVISSAV